MFSEERLAASGPRSEEALAGEPTPLARGGYVRVYPFVGGLPAIPGRYYARARVLCLYWHEPPTGCTRLAAAGTRLLAPLAQLPQRRKPPTTVTAVRYRQRLLRYADGNIFAAVELALEQWARGRAVPTDGAIPLIVEWRGPQARRRPRLLWLTPAGVIADRQLYPLGRGPWCYLAENVPGAPATLIEASAKLCR